MEQTGNGPPTYTAECRPDFIRFTYIDAGPPPKTRVRDIDVRKLLADAEDDAVMIAWASFQTLCGIESVLKSIDKRLEALIVTAEKASAAAVARMPDPRELLAMIQSGNRPPRIEPIGKQAPD